MVVKRVRPIVVDKIFHLCEGTTPNTEATGAGGEGGGEDVKDIVRLRAEMSKVCHHFMKWMANARRLTGRCEVV